jgi:hypothetical protein
MLIILAGDCGWELEGGGRGRVRVGVGVGVGVGARGEKSCFFDGRLIQVYTILVTFLRSA